MAWAATSLLALASCSIGDEPARLHTAHPPPAASGVVTVDARKPLLPTFPCARCHASGTADTRERRLIEFHTNKVLDHGTQRGWCYRCHTQDHIDQLHLGDGTLVSFDEAYELCGSCHGDKLRDWRLGIHGLTTGYWLGDRQRRSCPACHDPHSPRFPHMTPEHAPALPRTVRRSETPTPQEERHGE
jgi:formate-dependent nitrite reductase cytochrome c552 subunit